MIVSDVLPTTPWSADYRIPAVRLWMHNFGYHVVVVIPTDDNDHMHASLPTDDDIAVLASYKDYWLRQMYNERYIESMLVAGPYDIDNGVNTRTFFKSSRTGGWHYCYLTWTLHGPRPFLGEPKQYFDLVELLDYIERDDEDWQQWKDDHPEVFISG